MYRLIVIFVTILTTVDGFAIISDTRNGDNLTCQSTFGGKMLETFQIVCDDEILPLNCSLLSPVFITSRKTLCLKFGYILDNFYHHVSLTVRLVSTKDNRTMAILFRDSTDGQPRRSREIINATITIPSMVQEETRLVFESVRWPGDDQDNNCVILFDFVGSNGHRYIVFDHV